MHHEPRRFIYHQKVLVLEHHRNSDVLGFQSLLDEPGLDPFSGAHLVSGGGRVIIYPHRPILDHATRSATTHIDPTGDELVEALAGLF
jgi:hypothetical protein